jgi:putative transposase
MTARQVFAAIVYVLRTGIQWKALPCGFGSASAVHRHFQDWQKAGLFLKLWQAGLAEYDGMQGIGREWQSIDGATGKAPLATECVGPNPTDGGKNGRKRSLFVGGRGRGPHRQVLVRGVGGVRLSLAASGANVHDVKLLEPTLDAIATPRTKPSAERPQHFGADAGYKGQAVLHAVQARGYQPHIE